ncbi:MAG: DUF2330 domain-containing protein [Pirellulales bacterium]
MTVGRWAFDVGRSMFSVAAMLAASVALADPCGMIPPVYLGDGVPIARIGEQKTYVAYKDGIETFVIRPGFSGKVDEFGMLIPFPTPPAVRKVPDNVFPQIAAAIDPPEVVIYANFPLDDFVVDMAFGNEEEEKLGIHRDEVRVLRQEAVGMYEVTVLEAGSAEALKRWMDQHGYRYPDGMDKVCNEYVDDGWCFVAIKTKVGQKKGVDPRPGQRTVDPQLPAGSTFDGHVQAMGFRFKTDELVVPMRLSAFNDGELRNIVYLLTDGPRRIRSIPEEYVVRQLSGKQLYANVTQPLPLRIIGGGEEVLEQYDADQLAQQRDPEPKNGVAKVLFASDLLALSSNQLSLPHEEREKELLAIGEHLGLRGNEIDSLNAEALTKESDETVNKALTAIKDMTLTVVDGDFPREVLSEQNLMFAEYRMPRRRNNAASYDANQMGPAAKKEGILKVGALVPGATKKTMLADGLVLTVWSAFVAVLVVPRQRRPESRRAGTCSGLHVPETTREIFKCQNPTVQVTS